MGASVLTDEDSERDITRDVIRQRDFLKHRGIPGHEGLDRDRARRPARELVCAVCVRLRESAGGSGCVEITDRIDAYAWQRRFRHRVYHVPTYREPPERRGRDGRMRIVD